MMIWKPLKQFMFNLSGVNKILFKDTRTYFDAHLSEIITLSTFQGIPNIQWLTEMVSLILEKNNL